MYELLDQGNDARGQGDPEHRGSIALPSGEARRWKKKTSKEDTQGAGTRLPGYGREPVDHLPGRVWSAWRISGVFRLVGLRGHESAPSSYQRRASRRYSHAYAVCLSI